MSSCVLLSSVKVLDGIKGQCYQGEKTGQTEQCKRKYYSEGPGRAEQDPECSGGVHPLAPAPVPQTIRSDATQADYTRSCRL